MLLAGHCIIYRSITVGKNDSTIRSNYYIWNGVTDIAQWGSPTARMINGTDAIVFHTNISRTDMLTAFTDDFKRYVRHTQYTALIVLSFQGRPILHMRVMSIFMIYSAIGLYFLMEH